MPVRGHLQPREGKLLLVLDERLTGHDTFLSAVVCLEAPVPVADLRVRILTFDDVTVLSPLDGPDLAGEGGVEWSGTLLLPHGSRPPGIPDDFARAAAEADIDTSAWSPAEARQLLTYLSEASGPVRTERIRVIVEALARPA
ncbi:MULTISPECIES: hypothetical protein [Streptomyces]|uniref:hypothetical protein n=1 Tax=Streptomyces TaxID=1883 RepID=UPI00287F6342|nr:hypothetical protein [Streptomyces sp. CGMCC 4.1456]WNF67166.1 hypothetical protein RJD14_33390 [Streptomyces sp. CGMCC 4.1456]